MEELIKITGLCKQYMSREVLKDVSFSLKKDMILGLVGPNGAGKTTVMKTLGGLIMPTSGTVELFGESSPKGLAHSRSRMCFMIETPYAKQNMSARENLEKLRLQKGIPDKSRIDRALELAGLTDTGKKPVKDFSLGMKQRLGLAGALLSQPEIMILDEPINGLDPEGIVEIRELLLKLNREEHITLMISSHILSEMALMCTDYVFIRKGRVIENISAEDLKRRSHEYFLIRADKNDMVPAVLQNKLGITDIEVDKDGSVRVFKGFSDIRLISKTLFDNGIVPLELHLNDADLEKYYMDLVGENGEEGGDNV
ncbi:MAG: ABC transporter ATP-binding protein [Ruminococcus sp.]|nr:ABC transporter ATP-binding protein [Ruminococcus sp.]